MATLVEGRARCWVGRGCLVDRQRVGSVGSHLLVWRHGVMGRKRLVDRHGMLRRQRLVDRHGVLRRPRLVDRHGMLGAISWLTLGVLRR